MTTTTLPLRCRLPLRSCSACLHRPLPTAHHRRRRSLPPHTLPTPAGVRSGSAHGSSARHGGGCGRRGRAPRRAAAARAAVCRRPRGSGGGGAAGQRQRACPGGAGRGSVWRAGGGFSGVWRPAAAGTQCRAAAAPGGTLWHGQPSQPTVGRGWGRTQAVAGPGLAAWYWLVLAGLAGRRDSQGGGRAAGCGRPDALALCWHRMLPGALHSRVRAGPGGRPPAHLCCRRQETLKEGSKKGRK